MACKDTPSSRLGEVRAKVPKSPETRIPCSKPGHGLGFAAPMSQAVIRTGGKQYRVAAGDTIRVEKLEGAPGAKVEFSEVLFVAGDAPKIGKPTVKGAKVEGEIVAQEKGDKLIVFKFRKRKRYRRKAGHRQKLTSVKITGVKA
jgi:large subunit ribosomal protein L21